jgi:hypothetical protein
MLERIDVKETPRRPRNAGVVLAAAGHRIRPAVVARARCNAPHRPACIAPSCRCPRLPRRSCCTNEPGAPPAGSGSTSTRRSVSFLRTPFRGSIWNMSPDVPVASPYSMIAVSIVVLAEMPASKCPLLAPLTRVKMLREQRAGGRLARPTGAGVAVPERDVVPRRDCGVARRLRSAAGSCSRRARSPRTRDPLMLRRRRR